MATEEDYTIRFSTEQRKLSELVPLDWNPRTINRKQLEDLEDSLSKFELAEIPVINLDNNLVAGHQRVKILSVKKGGDFVIDVRVPHRMMTLDEVKEYNIRSNKNTASFDRQKLGENFERVELEAWGFDKPTFKELGMNEKKEGGDYTRKIEAPTYEPTSEEPPEVDTLFNIEKCTELMVEISETKGLPNEVKNFLTFAAYRHVVFDYQAIAEYYAHAPKNVQELMEKSALVIIDFDNAVENGFVSLTGDLKDAYSKDHNPDAKNED